MRALPTHTSQAHSLSPRYVPSRTNCPGYHPAFSSSLCTPHPDPQQVHPSTPQPATSRLLPGDPGPSQHHALLEHRNRGPALHCSWLSPASCRHGHHRVLVKVQLDHTCAAWILPQLPIALRTKPVGPAVVLITARSRPPRPLWFQLLSFPRSTLLTLHWPPFFSTKMSSTFPCRGLCIPPALQRHLTSLRSQNSTPQYHSLSRTHLAGPHRTPYPAIALSHKYLACCFICCVL